MQNKKPTQLDFRFHFLPWWQHKGYRIDPADIVIPTHCAPENVKKLSQCKTRQENINGAKVWDIFKNQIFMRSFDILAEMKMIKCPTLIIHGNEDVIPLISSEHIHEAIDASELVSLEQCGHFPFVEQPESFFNAIHSFLKN